MTLSAIEIKRVQKHLANPNRNLEASLLIPSQTDRRDIPMSGKTLARRLKGLLSREKANRFERHIKESCELLDD